MLLSGKRGLIVGVANKHSIAWAIAQSAAGQGAHGNVDILEGILIGIPAIGGVVVGTGLQQRLPERGISLLFAVLLVAIAVELIVP